MNTAKITGKVEDGKFIANSPRNFANAFKAFDGKDVVVTIAKPTKQRSNAQNAYLFGGPYKIISEHTGDDTDSIHHAMKDMFAKTNKKGCTVPVIEKTSKMTTVRFIKYYEDVIQWASAFLGLYIAFPNEEEMWGDARRKGTKCTNHDQE